MEAEDPGSALCCAVNCLSGLGQVSSCPSMVLSFFIYEMRAFARKPLRPLPVAGPGSVSVDASLTLLQGGARVHGVCLPVPQGARRSVHPPRGAPPLPPLAGGDPEPDGPRLVAQDSG